MKSISRIAPALTLAAIISPFAPAVAEQPSGFYLGVGLGTSDTDMSVREMDDVIRDAFRSQGASATKRNSSIDTTDSSVYVFAGYRILPWLSAEGGYVDLGTTRYDYSGTASIPFGGTQQVGSHLDIETKGAAVSALGHLPLGDFFDLHGRLGFLFADTEATATVRIGNQVAVASDSSNSFGAQIGLGAGLHLGDHFSLSADWTHYIDVGNGTEDDDDGSYDNGFDVDVLAVSAIVRF